MKIGFDHQVFVQQAYGGISRYVVSLAEAFQRLGHQPRIYAWLHQNDHLERVDTVARPCIRLNDKSLKLPKSVMNGADWLVGSCQLHIEMPQVLHETYYSRHGLWEPKVPRVITVHDMIHERFPADFPTMDTIIADKKAAFNRADHVICISQSTKHDLCALYGVADEKISVVHHGFDRLHTPVNGEQLLSALDKPFVLFVGQRGGYKNFKGLIQAVARSSKLKSSVNVIAFGGGSLTSDELAMIKATGLALDAVKQIGGSDAVLASLYSSAAVFVYPTLYEGFGFPPLEAMVHSCPVVASNSSSMPEVIGDAGLLVEPGSIDAYTDAIERVVFDSDLRIGLIARGHQRLSNFSWERCANETLDVYRKVC